VRLHSNVALHKLNTKALNLLAMFIRHVIRLGLLYNDTALMDLT
jgi:hypothetical protein